MMKTINIKIFDLNNHSRLIDDLKDQPYRAVKCIKIGDPYVYQAIEYTIMKIARHPETNYIHIYVMR